MDSEFFDSEGGSTLHEKAQRVLAAVDASGGAAHTSLIRERTGLSAQVIGYHARSLVDDGLLERGEEEVDVGAPTPANLYHLTERGAGVADVLEDPLSRADLQAEVTRQQEVISQLQIQVADLEARVESLDRDVAENEGAIERVVNVVESLATGSDKSA